MKNNYLDKYDPWEIILEDTYFALQSTHCTKLQATSVQLIFGCYMILDISSIYDCKAIGIFEKELINKNNQNKNEMSNLMIIEYVGKY